ncbi:MAG: uroporphyrinogen decarboxylase [Acidobacteriaceae bacterium]|nr:uroporphyrinogen decarboxylase [Acidobacteriaceae bacterium]
MRVASVGGRFLDACRRRSTDVRPVWFMRQAGRYLKPYREIRAKHSILEICKKPDLAAAVTLQPVEILDVDAAIIFADLLLPIEPMGLKLEFVSGEGPCIDNPVTEPDDIDGLSTDHTDDLGYVAESIKLVTRALAGRVPVVGFVGAPFTLASYMIEGGASKTFLKTKRLMFGDEVMWRRLMGKLVDVLGEFAGIQIGAGARAIQVFDSWVGALSPEDYVRYVQPYSRALIERIRGNGVPVIHFGTGAAGFFRELHAAGGDVIGVDWRINIDQAWMDIGYRAAIQGNLDPVALFAPLPELRTKVTDLLRRTGTRPGHIVNLGHGILPETPVESVKAVVQIVREFHPKHQ